MTTKKKRILLIDDEPGFTRLLRLNLEATGSYDVRIENDGTKGLAVMKEFRPDLVVLDVVMPDVDGGERAAANKTAHGLKDTPILFLTAVVSKTELKSRGDVIGGHPFLAKPVSIEDLTHKIEKCLRAA